MLKHKRTVLIVDNDSTLGETLSPFLTDIDCEMKAAFSIAEALTLINAAPPSLIISIMTLHDDNALALFKIVRSRPRTMHIPFMVVADYGNNKIQNEALKAGIDDFIIRPFDAQLVILRIRNAIQRTEREGLIHPRTGLPTGALLTERIRALSDEYGWYKLDFGIDHFSAFVNRYGFMTGEEVLAYAVSLLKETIKQLGTAEDFLGQRDDSHFTLITKLANGPAIRAQLEEKFNQESQSFYSFMERDQGFVEVEDGQGGLMTYPLMAASIKIQEGEADD